MADSKSPAAPRFSILLIVSCSAAWVIAQLSYNALPQLLGPIKVAFNRSDEVVTRMYGYELFVFAIVALVAAGPLARFSRVLGRAERSSARREPRLRLLLGIPNAFTPSS
jgi:hypothetical protein